MPSPRRKRGTRTAPPSECGSAPTGEVFTIDDLVVYLKLPKSTVYKLAQEGKIPGQKVGRHWRFHRATIERWLANTGPLPPDGETRRSTRKKPATR